MEDGVHEQLRATHRSTRTHGGAGQARRQAGNAASRAAGMPASSLPELVSLDAGRWTLDHMPYACLRRGTPGAVARVPELEAAVVAACQYHGPRQVVRQGVDLVSLVRCSFERMSARASCCVLVRAHARLACVKARILVPKHACTHHRASAAHAAQAKRIVPPRPMRARARTHTHTPTTVSRGAEGSWQPNASSRIDSLADTISPAHAHAHQPSNPVSHHLAASLRTPVCHPCATAGSVGCRVYPVPGFL